MHRLMYSKGSLSDPKLPPESPVNLFRGGERPAASVEIVGSMNSSGTRCLVSTSETDEQMERRYELKLVGKQISLKFLGGKEPSKSFQATNDKNRASRDTAWLDDSAYSFTANDCNEAVSPLILTLGTINSTFNTLSAIEIFAGEDFLMWLGVATLLIAMNPMRI